MIKSAMFHFLNSVYFIPHARISEGKTICLSLEKDVVLLFLEKKTYQKIYERHASSSWSSEAGSRVQRDARDCVDFQNIVSFLKPRL